MEKHNSFLSRFVARKCMVKNLIVTVVVRCMWRLIPLLVGVRQENLDARTVRVRLGALGNSPFATTTAMAQCPRCKESRKREGLPPRELVRLAPEVTQDSVFKRKGLPVTLCSECDGGAAELAEAVHARRVGN